MKSNLYIKSPIYNDRLHLKDFTPDQFQLQVDFLKS